MKFKLLRCNNEYHLLLATGEIKTLTLDEAAYLIRNFDSFELNGEVNPFSVKLFNEYEGELLASLSDDHDLTIHDATFLNEIFFDENAYVSIKEFGDIHGKKRAIICRMCGNGRLHGAIQRNGRWYIPKDAPYPEDGRAGRDMSKRYANKK